MTTHTIRFYTQEGRLFPKTLDRLKMAKSVVFGENTVNFERVDKPVHANVVISNESEPYSEAILCRELRQARDGKDATVVPFDCDPNDVLYFDIETHSADEMWDLPAEEFFRLGQYAWGPHGKVHLTRDRDELINVLRKAKGVVGHNIHNFDLSALFGKDSIEPLLMAQQGKVFDTMVYAVLAMPSPYVFTTRKGTQKLCDKPEAVRSWLALDNLCFQLGLDGKIGDLKAMAKEFGGFCHIPLDNEEFLEYAVQDVTALQELTTALLQLKAIDAYDWREQLKAAIDAQITRNGFRVDPELAQKRVDELAVRKNELMTVLVERYGMPTEGKSPWASNVGKAAVIKALQDHGVDPTKAPWPQGKTGPGLGGPVLKERCEGTSAQEFAATLTELKGQRSLAQLALDSMHSDGFTHPDISSLQRSGRSSVTKPGLTVWSARGPKAIEKAYFIPDNSNERLVAFDYSQADARIVAAYSGDKEFAKRFEPGSDAHEITGRLVFGDDKYDSDPDNYRFKSKALGHAYAYRAGVKTLQRTSGQPLSVAKMFVTQMEKAYSGVTRWQERVTSEGDRGSVTNDWGRRMVIEEGRSFTQSPAMYGQSGTRELMTDGLLRLLDYDVRLIQMVKIPVHDELIFSIPKQHLDPAVPKIKELMESYWEPRKGGQLVHFPVGSGEPAEDWFHATH